VSFLDGGTHLFDIIIIQVLFEIKKELMKEFLIDLFIMKIMDQIDEKILALLQENSRLTNKEIGAQVFLSGQAVGNRIGALIDAGIIEKFTISLNRKISPLNSFASF
jgi:predicted HTH transcriptional regulator